MKELADEFNIFYTSVRVKVAEESKKIAIAKNLTLSEVIPILKEGDYEIPNDNRPVSLLPVASKICERVALNRWNTCIRKGVSLNIRVETETLNILVSDLILDAMDRKELTAVVLLDLSKAFDSIEHSLLFKKLHSLGVSRKAVDWFKSYLSDRSQSVRIGHILSEGRVITHGIPQGSILGPALFSIYINDSSTRPPICHLFHAPDFAAWTPCGFDAINFHPP